MTKEHLKQEHLKNELKKECLRKNHLKKDECAVSPVFDSKSYDDGTKLEMRGGWSHMVVYPCMQESYPCILFMSHTRIYIFWER